MGSICMIYCVNFLCRPPWQIDGTFYSILGIFHAQNDKPAKGIFFLFLFFVCVPLCLKQLEAVHVSLIFIHFIRTRRQIKSLTVLPRNWRGKRLRASAFAFASQQTRLVFSDAGDRACWQPFQGQAFFLGARVCACRKKCLLLQEFCFCRAWSDMFERWE